MYTFCMSGGKVWWTRACGDYKMNVTIFTWDEINNCRWSLKSSWKSTRNTLVTSQIEQWKSMCSKCLREEIGCYIILSQLLQSSHYKMKWYCREGSEKNTWSANYTIKLQNENKSKIKCKHKTRNTANTVVYYCTKM